MIEITINNNKYNFEKNITVLQACEQANITVPRFCYHEKLSVAGSCRMCLRKRRRNYLKRRRAKLYFQDSLVTIFPRPLIKRLR